MTRSRQDEQAKDDKMKPPFPPRYRKQEAHIGEEIPEEDETEDNVQGEEMQDDQRRRPFDVRQTPKERLFFECVVALNMVQTLTFNQSDLTASGTSFIFRYRMCTELFVPLQNPVAKIHAMIYFAKWS
ncbi:hypothetical protein VNI00_006438 [Paramarasmius palmivorus]|uniref:Uncharacterized protein n=1 Tax=Paramarasmius palmivorus TaxID=297713 RepID=A0AAW0D5C6_9AGAR